MFFWCIKIGNTKNTFMSVQIKFSDEILEIPQSAIQYSKQLQEITSCFTEESECGTIDFSSGLFGEISESLMKDFMKNYLHSPELGKAEFDKSFASELEKQGTLKDCIALVQQLGFESLRIEMMTLLRDIFLKDLERVKSNKKATSLFADVFVNPNDRLEI